MAAKRLDPKSIEGILSELNCSVDDLLTVLSKYKVKKQKKPVNKTIERIRNRNRFKSKSFRLYRKIINKYRHLKPTSKRLKRAPKEPEPLPKEKTEPIRNQLRESIGLLRNKKKDGAIVPVLPFFEEKRIKECPRGFITQILNDIVNVATYEVDVDVGNVPQIKCEEYDIGFNTEDLDQSDQVLEEDTKILSQILDKTPREVYIDEPVAHCSKSPTIYLYPSSLFPSSKSLDVNETCVKAEVISECAIGDSSDVLNRTCDVTDSVNGTASNNNCRIIDDVTESISSDSMLLDINSKTSESTIGDGNAKNGAAFVSDALDEYLHDDCHLLKISYEVPQLTVESRADINDNTVLTPEMYGVKTTGIRKKKQDSAIKVKTVAEKRKLLETSAQTAVRSTTPETNPTEPETPITRVGLLFYNKKKLFVPVKHSKKPIIHIDFYDFKVPRVFRVVPPLEKLAAARPQQVNKKLRLWGSPKRPLTDSTKYFPGPLCMKTQLEDQTDFKHWRTVIKKLPKVSVEVTPLLGRRIHPKIRHFLPTSGEDSHVSMSEERVDFALSVLVERGKPFPPHETHKFHVPYVKNQQHFIAKRRVDVISLLVPKIPVATNVEVSDEIKSVVDDMLDFVERKEELEKNVVVNEAEVYVDEGKKASTPKKKTFVKSRTFYEARRLNLRFIKVDGVGSNEGQPCNNSFCTLGCVCSSLSYVQVLAMHCGRVDCMFECTCGFKTTNMNALSDLSAGTVTTVSNVSKKGLAKEEEEFMQTVIQGDNNTIVVTPGGRERSRRNIKVPKKYDDDNFVGVGLVSLEYCTDMETLKKFALTRKVTVNIEKVDLSNIIPFCMVHEVHNCSCLPEEVIVKPKRKPKPKPVPVEEPTRVPNTVFKPPSHNNLLALFKEQWNYRFAKDSSARMRGIACYEDDFLEYLRKRNRHPNYLHAIIERVSKEGGNLVQIKYVESESMNVKKRKRKQNLEARYEPILMDDEDTSKPPYYNYYQNEYAIQRRRTKMRKTATPMELFDKIFEDAGIMSKIFSPNEFLKSHFVKILPMCPPNSEFRLVPWETMMKCYTTEMLHFWFAENPLCTKILVTDRTERPSKKCVSFKLFEGVANKIDLEVDIIHWIVNRRVPKNKAAESVVIILCFFDPYWEMVGIFEKVGPMNIESNECLSAVFMPTSLNGHEYNIQDLVAPSEKKNCTNFYYTDVDDNEKTTTSASKEYSLINLQCNFDEKAAPFLRGIVKESFLDNDNKIIVSVHLPESRNECKWRILCLDSNFTYLYFNRNGFSIQCKDLGVLLKQSHIKMKTMILHVQSESDRKYPHYKFGIYASPNCKDAVFIGPYYDNEEHDYELLQHIGGDLVNVDIIMPAEAKINLKKGIWFYKYEPPIDLEETTNVEKPSIIKSRLRHLLQMYKQKDAAGDDQKDSATNSEDGSRAEGEQDLPQISTPTPPPPPPPPKETETLTNSNDLIIEVDDEQREQYYFITNINLLGYIRGEQLENGHIAVCMYYERFVAPNVQDIVKKIDAKLLESLIPVPSNFRLNVIQVDKEVIKNYRPLESRYLKVFHLVGEFGVLKLTNNNLSMVKSITGISDDEEREIRKSAIYSQYNKFLGSKQDFVKQTMTMTTRATVATTTITMMTTMSTMATTTSTMATTTSTMTTKSMTSTGGVTDVVTNAIDVIKSLEETERELSGIKKQLEAEKVARTGRLLNMICRLPKEQQSVAKEEMKKILQLYLSPRPIEKFNGDFCPTPKSTDGAGVDKIDKKSTVINLADDDSVSEKRQSLLKSKSTTSTTPNVFSTTAQRSILLPPLNPPSLVPLSKPPPKTTAKITKVSIKSPLRPYINTLQQNNVVISTSKPPTNVVDNNSKSSLSVTAPKEPPKLIRIKGNNDKSMIIKTTKDRLHDIPVYQIQNPNYKKANDATLKKKVFSTINSIRQRVTDEIEITATTSVSKDHEETVVVNGTKGIEHRTDATLNSAKAVIIDSKGQSVNYRSKKTVQAAQVLVKADVFKNNDKPVSLLKNDVAKDVTIKPTDTVLPLNNSDTSSGDNEQVASNSNSDENPLVMDLDSNPEVLGQPVVILPGVTDNANIDPAIVPTSNNSDGVTNSAVSSDQNVLVVNMNQLPMIEGTPFLPRRRKGLRPILPKGGIIEIEEEEPPVNPVNNAKRKRLIIADENDYINKKNVAESTDGTESTPENVEDTEETPASTSVSENTLESVSVDEDTPNNPQETESTPENPPDIEKKKKISKVPRMVKLTSDTGEDLGSVSLLKPAIIRLKKGGTKKRKYLLVTKPILVKDDNFLAISESVNCK